MAGRCSPSSSTTRRSTSRTQDSWQPSARSRGWHSRTNASPPRCVPSWLRCGPARLRIVEAGDAERRRVERDLHDGAQQRLVALAMRLQLERERGGDSRALIDDASAELEAAIAEVRDLARGLHPAILSEAGLAAAIDSLAERAPMPVRVEAPEQRFPRGVEATAYYVTAEGLTNVARHAGATEARVRVTVDGDHLTIDIADDGVGGADLDRGSGLRGLVDRVAAAGGSLSVTSPAGAGTLTPQSFPSRDQRAADPHPGRPRGRREPAARSIGSLSRRQALMSSDRRRTSRADQASSTTSRRTSRSSMSACHRRTRRRAWWPPRRSVGVTQGSASSSCRSTSKRNTPSTSCVTTRQGSATSSRIGYSRIDDLSDSVRRVAGGGSVIDPEVVGRLLGRARRGSPLDELTRRSAKWV